MDYGELDGYFKFQNRCIWYKVQSDNLYGRMISFYDGKLAEQERQDYITRLDREIEGYSLANFREKQCRFGTLTLVTNLPPSKKPQSVYECFKSRMGVEQLFDTFKNTLEADRTYMRSVQGLETWLFINHISLMLYYALYARLQQVGSLKKFSPTDVLRYGKQIRKIKMNKNWYVTEIPSKMQKLLKQINTPVT